ncbi:ornithine carbamoyltransferase [Dactylosporangium sp. NPDC051484]|uniref:ornithine carbamoyltransferase n=1 Tax=Dactylosporangium sp. NPDC051484 TaxID=3154942 RepID=UPI0034506634
MTGPRRHLLTLDALSAGELDQLVRRAAAYAAAGGRAQGRPLDGATVGIYFRRTSTRTRTSFTVAAHRLGAHTIAYGPNDLQENTGETVEDTARVLSGMLDGFVARTAGDPAELRALAAQDRMTVVNAMTSDEHPTQAVADLATVLTVRGSLDGLSLLYLGEGNNTASALAFALARVPGACLDLRTPAGYGLPDELVRRAARTAAERGGEVTQRHDLADLPAKAHVVYTTRWQTTGTSKADPDWRRHFTPFQVSSLLLDQVPEAVFMHDLPARRGDEVEAAVLDGPRSIAFQQAEHKLHAAMAVLEWAVAGWR